MDFIYDINLETCTPRINFIHKMNNPKGWGRSAGFNPDYEIIYILAGKTRIRVLEKEYDLNPGNVLFLPPYLWHSYIPQQTKTSYYILHVNLNPALEEDYCHYAEYQTGPHALLIRLNGQSVIPLVTSRVPESLGKDFDILFENNTRVAPGRGEIQKLLNRESVFKIVRLLLDAAWNEQKEKNLPLEKSILFIEQNFSLPLSLPQLAKMEEITPNYYSHLFKTHYGLSPVEYITEKRINLARKLLAKGTLKIKDIARQTGFEDEYYFSKVFKKTTTFSPREYRKLLI